MELISRADALNFEASIAVDDPDDVDLIMKGAKLYMEYIKSLPLVDITKTGTWLDEGNPTCSVCGYSSTYASTGHNYCPFCGAKMKGGKHE